MRLMTAVNFVTVFIGVESPNEASLRETKKFQDARTGTLTDKVHTIQNAGPEVWCGMIVGFDHDDVSIFASQRRFIRESRIQPAMIGMLVAIPKTPSYARLADEGRLDGSDTPACGTNVIPLRLSREELRDGDVRLMQDLYEPEPYFDSLDGLYLDDDFQYALPRGRYWRQHPLSWLKTQTTSLVRFLYLYRRLTHDIPDTRLRQCYRTRLRGAVRRRPDPEYAVGLRPQVWHALSPPHHGDADGPSRDRCRQLVLTTPDEMPRRHASQSPDPRGVKSCPFSYWWNSRSSRNTSTTC